MDPRNLLNAPPPAAAAGRAGPGREAARQGCFPARAAGSAPGQPDLCLLPRPHGPAGLCPGALRRHRPVAREGRQVRHRHLGDVAGRPVLQGARGPADDPEGRPGGFHRVPGREDADLCPGAGPGAWRPKDREGIAERVARRTTTASPACAGESSESAPVPDEERKARGGTDDHHQKTPVPPDVLAGRGAVIGLPLLDAMVPALGWAAGREPGRPCGSASSTSPTAWSCRTGRRPRQGRDFEFTPILRPLERFRDTRSSFPH